MLLQKRRGDSAKIFKMLLNIVQSSKLKTAPKNKSTVSYIDYISDKSMQKKSAAPWNILTARIKIEEDERKTLKRRTHVEKTHQSHHETACSERKLSTI